VRILLIGATGFLGSQVAARLADRDPIVLARDSSDCSVLPPRLEIRTADLTDRSLPLRGVDTLVYCASMGSGHIPALLPQFEQAAIRRAVFLSTTAIFTSLPSASRATRLQAETVVTSSALDWTILRPTMIYGTARDRNISRLLRYLRRWPLFPWCGNALWQPVHVDDLADATVSALDAPTTIGKAYNVAGADAISFGALVRTAAAAINRRVVLVPVPVQAAIAAAKLTRVVRPEQIQRLSEDKSFSNAAAIADFHYHPRPFAQGVREEAISLGYQH
jgi:nucleoside-diphosphate-sugar epimerase